MGLQQFDEMAVINSTYRKTDADTGDYEYAAAGNNMIGPYRVDVLVATNTGVDPVTLFLAVKEQAPTDETSDFASVVLPAGAGVGAVPSVDVLQSIGIAGLAAGMVLDYQMFLFWRISAPPSTGKLVVVYSQAGSV